VIFCDATNENCCQFLNAQKENENERYTVEKLSDLIMRYERPETKNRWDSPLFTVTIDHRSEDQLPRKCPIPLADIYSALIEGRPLASYMSTQSAPLARTDFLQDIDRITQTIVISVMEQQQTAMPGDQLTVPGIDGDENRVNFTGIRSLPALTRLKRQFITYTKMHPIDGERRLAALFVNFLNNNR